jgi:hypothetical protein
MQHKDLAQGRWFQLSLIEQLAHIGSEVSRSLNWKNKGDPDYSRQAFYRFLELVDLTKADPKNRHRLKEICRIREIFADYLIGDNLYHTTDQIWTNYFLQFAIASRKQKEL